MANIPRIGPEEARRAVAAGRALLVCAYDDEGASSKMRLEGAVSMADLKGRLSSLPKDFEIVFYCA